MVVVVSKSASPIFDFDGIVGGGSDVGWERRPD